MSSKLYDSMKWTALVLLPGLGALYFGLGQLWDFPEVEKVVGSVTVLEVFIGLLLRKSASDYGSAQTVGDAIVIQDKEGTVAGMRFELDASTTPLVLNDKKIAQFNVRREQH